MSARLTSASGRPKRGTRPHNRRDLIIEAATALFSERGYANVAMSDVAEAVAIGPSALYRHFAGKRELLFTVIEDALRAVDDVLRTSDAARPLADVLADATLSQRRVGVLWRREARQLDGAEQVKLRRITRRISDRLTQRIQARRATLSREEAALVTRCALAVANSVSFHTRVLPEPELSRLLAQLIEVALVVPVDAESGPTGNRREIIVASRSRREAILASATSLFAQRGFAGVSIDDIGAAVGIAGPSVYNHYASKSESLSAAMTRGAEWLRLEFDDAVAGADSAADALRRIVHGYQEFAFDNPRIVEVLLSEVGQLPPPEGRRARRSQHAYIADWVSLARQVRPDWSDAEAQIRVQAAQMLINETVVSVRAGQPDPRPVVAVVAAQLLDVAG